MGSAWQLLVMALLFLMAVGRVSGQASDPALARLVQLSPGTRPLGVVLAELSRQGHLPLSYSSSLVPMAHPSHLVASPARPLGVVLGEVLAAERLSFGLLNGQLVLWPSHLAVPASVLAVNGRPTSAAQTIRVPAVSTVAATGAAVPATGGAKKTDRNTAAGSTSLSSSLPVRESGKNGSSAPMDYRGEAAARSEAASFKGLFPVPPPSPSVSAATPAAPRPTRTLKPTGAEITSSALSSTPKNASPNGVAPTKRAVAFARNKANAARQFVAAKPTALRSARTLSTTQAARTAAKSTAIKSVVAGGPARIPAGSSSRRRVVAQPNIGSGQMGERPEAANTPADKLRQQPSGAVQGPVALLTFKTILPIIGPESAALLLSLQPPTEQAEAATRKQSVSPDNSATAAAKTPFALASLLRPSYLHAETWGSETLPLSATIKIGFPRIYLTIGAAAGPLGHQSGGVAGGIGLGTTFEARGRFTPSLDLLQWFLTGDRQMPGSQLTQLRPLLAWQIKQGGRLQLMAGPSLNLATGARAGGGRPRGDGELGQGQWLWLNAGDDRSFLRLWPGVQLGLRF